MAEASIAVARLAPLLHVVALGPSHVSWDAFLTRMFSYLKLKVCAGDGTMRTVVTPGASEDVAELVSGTEDGVTPETKPPVLRVS